MKTFRRILLAALLVLLTSFAGMPGIAKAFDPTKIISDVSVTPVDSGGYITSSPAGVDCGDGHTACSITQPYDTYNDLPTVTFIAHPDPGRVVRWGIQFIGYCDEFATTNTDTYSYHGNTCTIEVGEDGPGEGSLNVEWYYDTYNLTIPYEGTGSGHVSVSNGTNCSSTCTMNNVPLDSQLTLTATPDAGSTFIGWDVHSGYHWCERPSSAMLTTPTCKLMGVDAYDKSFDVPSPIFNSVSAVPSTTSSTSVSTSQAQPTPAQPAGPIKLADTQKLSLWQGNNFGQKDKALTAQNNDADTMVGIADAINTPLALVHMDLTKPQDWSKAKISYASSSSKHKSFVHGLATAPGVKNGIFTLLVPYQTGDKYVGICSGAASLDAVNSKCPGIYYLAQNQTKTHQGTAAIKSTVTANIITLAGKKYWQISGLTGTGGFSTKTAPVQKSSAKSSRPEGANRTMVWIGFGVVVVLALGVLLAKKFRLLHFFRKG